LTIEEFKELRDKGGIVIDTRHDYGGSKNFVDLESIKDSFLMTENGTVAAWVGLLLKPEEEILLFCSKDKSKEIIERLFRVGYFKIRGYNGFTLDEWQEKGLPIWEPKAVDGKAMSEAHGITMLDIRTLPEWRQNGVIEGAKLISLGDIPSKMDDLRGCSTIYIYCRTGARARVACSLLAQNNIFSVIVSESTYISILRILEFPQLWVSHHRLQMIFLYYIVIQFDLFSHTLLIELN
jgi:rhodanese-related sulfurtransferase